MSSVPATCGAGSTLAPAATTTFAWNTEPTTLAPQTLTCIISDTFLAGSTTVYDFTARVLPGFDEGTAIVATANVATTIDGTTYASGNESVTDTVTAAIKYDVQVFTTRGDQDTAG